MRDLVHICVDIQKIAVTEGFYKNWSNLQSALYQILVPPHWGAWMNKEKIIQL
jgi:hypothetical protein